MLIGNVHAALW